MTLLIESERKFLVYDFMLPSLPPGRTITSGYFTRPDDVVEVRIVHVKYPPDHPQRPGDEYARVGFKGPGGEHRVEWEPEAYRGEKMLQAIAMLQLAPAKTIKIRYDIGHWELDRYLGGAEGLYVVEWESSKHGPAPEVFPDWVGDEVTGEIRYKNVSVAWNTGRLASEENA